VRICNINVTAGGRHDSNLINTLITAANKVAVIWRRHSRLGAAAARRPNGQVNFSFFTATARCRPPSSQAMAKTNNFLTIEPAFEAYTAFRGIPIRICDQITNTKPA